MQILNGIFIDCIAGTIPKQCLTLMEYAPKLFTEKTAHKMINITGFSSLRITPDDMTFKDLVLDSAQRVIKNHDNIGAVVVVTQTSNYVLPALSHILQAELNLSNETICLDINEGCSGYITGLYVASLLAKQLQKSVLLCVGDTVSKLISPEDRSTLCVFADGATATLVSPTQNAEDKIAFQVSSYGNSDIIMMENKHVIPRPKNDGYFYMDGTEVMKFTLVEVVEGINAFLSESGYIKENIDLFAFHQANKLIVSSLANSLGITEDKAPFAAGKIGNTSSASIPLLLAALTSAGKVLCAGFGVGLSTGICFADFSKTKFYGVNEL